MHITRINSIDLVVTAVEEAAEAAAVAEAVAEAEAEAGEEDAEVAAAVGDAAWKAFLASGKRSPISSGTISATPRPEIRSPSEPWVFAIADVDAEG